MAAPRIRIDYGPMQKVAQAFARESEAAGRTLQNLQRAMDALQGGDWVGRGAKAFYREMDSQVLPSLRRLARALNEAHRTTVQISQVMKQAEDEAARLFRLMVGGTAMAAIPGVDFSIPGWVWEFAIGLVPFGDAVDVIRQLWNRVRGREVDELILTLALLGVVADLGWLNPIPSAEDAPNAVLAALKALAKQVPPGAARDSLQEMVELAAKNADEARRLGEVLVALNKHSDLALALTKNPEALIAVMRHGPDAVGLLGKFSDDAIALVGRYGEEGIRILNRAESAAAGAYDVARAGGRHSGTLTNYVSRPAGEIERAARGYERVVTEHLQKLSNPEGFVEDWSSLSSARQELVLQGWVDDVIRNRELAAIMRKLAAEVRP